MNAPDIPAGLTLTPFEWTMSNELSGSVMEFVIRLCCTGSIDVERFNEAIATALKQQPLLQANATFGPTHLKSHWRTATDSIPFVRWLDGDPTPGRGATDGYQPIDLGKETGFRFYGWRFQIDGVPRTEIRFVFHHACCDGKGAISFIEHVLCQYKLLKEGKCDAMPSFDGDRILNRGQRASHKNSIADRVWRTFVVKPKRVANMLFTTPVSLDESEISADQLAAPPCQCSATLDETATNKLGEYANSVGATTNLVLARELFHVLGEYLESGQAKPGASRDGNLMRLLIPFSLRDETHQGMPAANCVSMAYLEAKRDSLDQDSVENSTLLADLVKQLAFIRRWQLQYSWIESIKSYAQVWPLLRLFKRSQKKGSDRQVSTTVFSNLGRAFNSGVLSTSDGRIKIDKLEIETVHLVLPCTDKQRINFTVNFYCDRLTLDVSYLPSAVTRETAQRLLDSWQSRILDVAQRSS